MLWQLPPRLRRRSTRSWSSCANSPAASSTARGDKKRAALDAFYSKRSYAPIWITEGKVNDRALAAIDYLGACRCRRPEPGRLRGAGCFLDDRSGEPRRGRTQAQRRGRRLRASRAGGTRALDARQRRHLLRHEGVGSGGRAGEPGGRQRCCRGAGGLRAASARLSGAQGKARRAARRSRRRRPAGEDRGRTGAESRHARRARTARSSASWRERRWRRLRQAALRRGEEVSAGQQPEGCGYARRADRRSAQRPSPGSGAVRRPHPRQHGTLAVDAARSRQDLRAGQSAGLHALRSSERPAGMVDADSSTASRKRPRRL